MTHPSMLVMSWEGIADFPCLLASSALEKYKQLPSKGKPLKGKEWTPMAAIIQHDASMSEQWCVRGHIQTICEKINVIMTLTPHPPPPPGPLSVIQNNHLYEGRKASKLYSPQGLNPYNTITFFFFKLADHAMSRQLMTVLCRDN